MQAGRERCVYRFAGFELDPGARRLSRELETIVLPDSHIEVLLLLASNAGSVVSKDVLHNAGWGDLAVTDNSIVQAVKALRETLGSQPGGMPFIETVSRRGYRFVAPVERSQPAPAAIDALLAPYRAFVDGRAALETLGLDAVARARQAFEDGLRAAPDNPAAHIGLANAFALQFESTRVDVEPNLASLQKAAYHAREACRLDPSCGDAWSALAFVRHRTGDPRDAIAAARKAVALEPNDWHHHLRLASVSWGEQRLRAAQRVLKLCPDLALAYWFAATVFVARQSFDVAIETLRAGSASQEAEGGKTSRFGAIGLHLLHGLVLAAQGAVEPALKELRLELDGRNEGHVYGRECCANASYACGALHLRMGGRDEAEAAFREALTRVPGHPFADVGLALLVGSSHGQARRRDANIVESAMVSAARFAVRRRHSSAARVCSAALAQAESGSAGWLLPVEPLLHATGHRHAWRAVLAALRVRAT